MTQTSTTTPRAGRREWLGLAVIALACVLYVMDLTVLHLAVPAISADLQPSSTQMLWIIDVYGFMVAGALITMGSLGDRIGRRRLLLIGAAAFGVTSVLAAFSTSPEMLIATRALLGLSGATLAPSTLSLIRSMFHDPQQRSTAIGIWITSFSAGAALGPVLGGVVLEFFWWGAVFLINVPVMVALLVLGPRLLPEYRDPNAGRADLPSAALSLIAMLALVYGLKQVAQDGVTAAAVITTLAGLGLGVVFVRRQRRLTDPLIDMALFRIPAFSAALATYGIGIFVVFGGFLFIPQYLQLVLGMSPLEAGLWTLPWALSFVVGSNVTPILARRIDPAWLMGGGLVIAALGFGVLLGVESGSGLPLIVLSSIGFSLGMSPSFTLTNDLIMGSAPPERAGAAAGVSETAAELGGALGIAVLGSIGVAVYRRGVNDALPDTLSAEDTHAAQGTLGGALDVAAGLPAATGDALVAAAEAAFTTGLHLGAAIAAVTSLALAGFVLARGPVGVIEESEPEPEPAGQPAPDAD